MKFVLIISITLGVLAPSVISAQYKNRISLQTGLFHLYFDHSSIINQEPNGAKKSIDNLFGGMLIDSKGFQYQRLIQNRMAISIEYMFLNAGYNYKTVYNDPEVKPVLFSKNIKTININYSYNFEINSKMNFILGGGLNYIFGHEQIYHYTFLNGWGEPRFYGYDRKDLGINLRSGIEFSPIPHFTLFTNLDFIEIMYLNTKDSDGNSANNFYKDNFGINYLPSRCDLSWRFGVGYNFGNKIKSNFE